MHTIWKIVSRAFRICMTLVCLMKMGPLWGRIQILPDFSLFQQVQKNHDMGDFGAPRKVLPTHYERFRTQLTYFHDFFFILKFSLEPSSQKACISPVGKQTFLWAQLQQTSNKGDNKYFITRQQTGGITNVMRDINQLIRSQPWNISANFNPCSHSVPPWIFGNAAVATSNSILW